MSSIPRHFVPRPYMRIHINIHNLFIINNANPMDVIWDKDEISLKFHSHSQCITYNHASISGFGQNASPL